MTTMTTTLILTIILDPCTFTALAVLKGIYDDFRPDDQETTDIHLETMSRLCASKPRRQGQYRVNFNSSMKDICRDYEVAWELTRLDNSRNTLQAQIATMDATDPRRAELQGRLQNVLQSIADHDTIEDGLDDFVRRQNSIPSTDRWNIVADAMESLSLDEIRRFHAEFCQFDRLVDRPNNVHSMHHFAPFLSEKRIPL